MNGTVRIDRWSLLRDLREADDYFLSLRTIARISAAPQSDAQRIALLAASVRRFVVMAELLEAR
jgi:hypothetical protein